jgi:hypothetical protein
MPSDLPKWRRMAHSLGQAVALQQLILDKDATVPVPLAKPEATGTQERVQKSEQQPVRARKQFSPGQEHSKPAQSKHGSHTASGMKRQRSESVPRETPARQPDGFPLPERPSSGKVRKVAGKQPRSGRTTTKHKAHAFAATEPQHRTARRKPRATRARSATASKR